MNGAFVLSAGVVGVLVLIGLAGLVYERLHKRDRTWGEDDQRRADQTMRYYRDVGDSTDSMAW